MKNIAYILSFVFLSFVAGPTIIALIDDSVDVSFAFTVNEEENSSKTVSFESLVEENYSNHESIEYLRTHQKQGGYSYKKNYHQVYLEITSPPPKNI